MDSPNSGRSASATATATEGTARGTPNSPGPSTANRSPFAFPKYRTSHPDEIDVQFRGGTHEAVSLQPGGKVNYGRSVSDTTDQFVSYTLAATTGSDFYTSEHSITRQSSSPKKSIVRSNTIQNSSNTSQKAFALNGSSSRNGQPGLARHNSVAIQSIQQPTVGLVPSRLTSINSRAGNSDGASGKSSRPNYERMHSGRMSVYIPEEPDQIDALPFTRPYRKRDVLLTIWAIGTYLWDYVSDWVVAAGLYRDKDYIWFGLTTAFIVVPHLTMTMFSLAWYLQDKKNNPSAQNITVKQWFVRIIVLMLQLAPVLRFDVADGDNHAVRLAPIRLRFPRDRHRALHRPLPLLGTCCLCRPRHRDDRLDPDPTYGLLL
ncbi:hypothetical protein RvY_15602-2 [Ramazzottius varieornatus]|uniref:XK-related protein n=1 Tax=Ramazzottius varieornatus TaxID=947166 RepID=A0A1D1VYP3_RAMVA|nr:hypothetical protein RvY_15602-2 [Ramazzottius varieornatus]